MPYIKNEELKYILRDAFLQGCNSGYGIDHEFELRPQEEEAFEQWYQFQYTKSEGAQTNDERSGNRI